ncbi:MAG: hypothetical protein P8J27_10015 [Mariniblastus sp.]|nr:hypothetical protein [Mariniblastus sp.]
MTAKYDKLGLKFLYPENWKLIDDSDSESPHVITLESPDGSCIWAVHVYPQDVDRDNILKETLASMQETYEDLEVSQDETELGGREAKGVETLFYCLDFLVRAQLHFVETEDHLLLFWTQSEDREFEKNAQVFKAISFSLLQSL